MHKIILALFFILNTFSVLHSQILKADTEYVAMSSQKDSLLIYKYTIDFYIPEKRDFSKNNLYNSRFSFNPLMHIMWFYHDIPIIDSKKMENNPDEEMEKQIKARENSSMGFFVNYKNNILELKSMQHPKQSTLIYKVVMLSDRIRLLRVKKPSRV